MKKIIVKEINKVNDINEYLIYLMVGPTKTPMKAFTEIGDENKNNRVTSLKAEYNIK